MHTIVDFPKKSIYTKSMAYIFKHVQNRRLAHVMRFNVTPQHFPESVVEHSYYTAYFVSILCYMLRNDEHVNTKKALEMALVHDMEEMFSGDIVTPFKHYSKEVEEAIAKVNKETIPRAFEDLPQGLAQHYINLWTEEGKGETIEAQVVKVADKLSLISKCAEEIRVGNESFQEIYNNGIQFLEAYNKPWWQKIKNQILAES
jgi:5'-deoxynucleotidase YfbR-like HD superfamily hydrolase